jgi:superfamily I DNA/RNA helicase/RecB family exonuclease
MGMDAPIAHHKFSLQQRDTDPRTRRSMAGTPVTQIAEKRSTGEPQGSPAKHGPQGSRQKRTRIDPVDLRIGPDDWTSAIVETDGPQLVVAGPGTGKTEFLVRRARHLIESGAAAAAEVLILAFSRRSAGEIAGRATSPLTSASPVATTFHSFAHRLLEAHGVDVFGWDQIPTLLTGPEQISLVSELMANEDPAAWPALYRPLLRSQTLSEEVGDFLLRCRERLLSSDDIRRRAAERPQWRALPDFMDRYDRELLARGRLDYGALLAGAVAALERPEIAAAVATQHRFVLVDEYQDTTPAQARLLELATVGHRNLTVTGDPYQSVYSFRGAELSNVADFCERFRDLNGNPARRLVLTTSFRVPAEILDAAVRVVATGDLPGAAGPVIPAPHAGRVEAYVFDQASAEAEWIAGQVERIHVEENLGYSRIGVLSRSSRTLLPELSRALERRRIPHNVSDRRMVDHPAVRIVFDLVEAAWTESAAFSGMADTDVAGLLEQADRAMRRLLLGPLFSLSISAERDLVRERRRTAKRWDEILRTHLADATEVAALLANPGWAIDEPAATGFWKIWTTIPQFERMVEDPSFAEFRIAWAVFSQALDSQFDRDSSVTLARYQRQSEAEDFEATTLLALHRPGRDQLTLTTLHQAKGLEFDVVFIADAAEGSFPDLRRTAALLHPEMLSPDQARSPETSMRFRLQEEMRLAYTAMTRAKRRVIWTATSAAIDEGERRPSRFLLAASGRSSFRDIGPPQADAHQRPITSAEAQAALRRTLTDPSAPAVDRLSALSTLCDPTAERWSAVTFAGSAERGPDTGVVTAPFRLSPSQAETYDQCPRQYAFERRLGAGDTFSPYAHYGSLIHLVLERSEAQAIAIRQPHNTLSETLEILEQVWATEADFGSPVLNDAWKSKGRDLLTKMHEKWPGGNAIPTHTEKGFELEIGGISWVGRADRIERQQAGQLRVIDYKTGSRQPTVPEAAQSLQLGFYLLAAAADPELTEHGRPTEAEFWHPAAGSPNPVRKFDPANLELVESKLRKIGAGIAAEEWPATPGLHCKYCSVRLICPAWPEGREAYV